MKKALKWVLILIAAVAAFPLLLIVLLLLCFPIRYRIYAKIDEGKDVRAKISYLFGFVRYKYSLKDSGTNETSQSGPEPSGSLWLLWHRFRPKEKNKATQKNAQGRKEKTSDIFSFVQEISKKEAIGKDAGSSNLITILKDILTYRDFKTIIKDSIKTVKKLLLAIRPKYIKIEGEFGLANPADTAFLYGGYVAASSILGIRKNVSLLPIFNNEAKILRLNADIRGRVNIYGLIIPVLRLFLTKPVRDILKGASYE